MKRGSQCHTQRPSSRWRTFFFSPDRSVGRGRCGLYAATASATSSSDAKPSSRCSLMNAPMRMAPSCSIFGATSTSTSAARDLLVGVGADRDHRRDATERRADEHRRLGERPGDLVDVAGERLGPVVAVVGPVALAVAAQVDPEDVPPALGEHPRRRSPREAGLAATVEQHDRGPVGITELVGPQPQTVAPEEVDGAHVVGAGHPISLPATWASRCCGRPCRGCRGRPPIRAACRGRARR